MDVWIPFEGSSKGMKNADKAGDKVFGFIQGEKEFFDHIGNSLKQAVEQVTVLKEKMAQRIVNSKDKMPVCAVNQLEGHGGRPVIRIFSPTGRAKLGMAAKRNELEVTAMGTAIHGAAVRRITAVDDLIDIFQNNRSGFYIIFNYFVIVSKYLLNYIHEIIMRQNKTKNKS